MVAPFGAITNGTAARFLRSCPACLQRYASRILTPQKKAARSCFGPSGSITNRGFSVSSAN